MRVRFWGVRGSVPTPGPNTVKYGGNTACIEVRGPNDELLVIDAGTGLRELGNFLISNDLPKNPLNVNIFLSHTHWDHIQGFPFFAPAYVPSSVITFRGPVNAIGGSLKDIVAGQMQYSYFPIKLMDLRGKIEFIEIKEQVIDLPPFEVSTCYLNHPILCLGYRISCGNKTLVTLYDNEPFRNIFAEEMEGKSDMEKSDYEEAIKEAEEAVNIQNKKVINFARNADLLIYDAQYTTEEYKTKIGWGHSTIDYAIDFGLTAKCKKLALFHHDPIRTDRELDSLQFGVINKLKEKGVNSMIAFFSRERLEIVL